MGIDWVSFLELRLWPKIKWINSLVTICIGWYREFVRSQTVLPTIRIPFAQSWAP